MRIQLSLVSIAFAAAPALAVPIHNGASVQIDAINFQLRDLAPGDGVRPWATLVAQSLKMQTTAYSYGPDGSQVGAGGRPLVSTRDGYRTTVLQLGASFATASAYSSGLNTFWLSASGTSATDAGRYDGFASSSRYTLAYKLAPHTEMTWQGQAAINAWAELGDVFQSIGRVTFGAVPRTFGAIAYGDYSLEQPLQYSAGTLDYVLRNDTNRAQRVAVSFTTLAAGGSAPEAYSTSRTSTALMAAPVPEPQTYALMLAGLGLVGFATRRRGGKEPSCGMRALA